MPRLRLGAIAVIAMVFGVCNSLLAEDAARREISHVAGDLYRFQNNFHVSVFLVTEDGVIATDPIDEAAASWLEAEIRKRFAKEIRYVVYSHSDADHVSGGAVFADTATVIAHENAKPIIKKSGHTAPPDITFGDHMSIELGGKTVELYFFAPSHTDNLIAMHFPEEKAVFVVDAISVKRLPYRTLSSYHIPGAMEFIKGVEGLDFEIFVGGHGPVGSKADVVDHRKYLETLHDQVVAARADGLSLAETKLVVDLSDYRDWGQYDAWREENIEGMYRLTGDQ